MSFLSDIGNFFGGIFSGLFNSAKKTYNKLPDEVKNGFLQGGGIVDIINSMADDVPEKVEEAIKAKFPNMDVQKIEEGLFSVAQTLGLKAGNNLREVIAVLQSHFKALEGKKWAATSHLAATLLAAIFGPPATKFGIFTSLMEWVYQRLIKKQVKVE